ncbi:MAG TPA: hypothetical protein VMB20_08715 [Candidatus Acidoferrum sp.]|nr:hypothetical protein [Candidatus Acidoferrum sp.]
MPKAINLLLAVALLAVMPSVADLDAHSRASGNRIDIATSVGEQLFSTTWPAQVLQVLANQDGTHIVLGLRVNGVKFHGTLTRNAFDREVMDLVARAFAAAPAAEEVDLWVTVPLSVGKGVVVSGDLAKPTTRTVFTVSVRRGEGTESLAARLRSGANVFLDQEWASTAFTKS